MKRFVQHREPRRDFGGPSGRTRNGIVRVAMANALVLLICFGGCKSSPDGTSPMSPTSSTSPQVDQQVDPQTRAVIEGIQAALENREYLRGLSLVDAATEMVAGQPAVQFLKGRLLHEVGRTDEAVAAFERVLSIAPDFPGAHHNLGNIAFEQSRFRDAIMFFKREAKDHPAARPWHGAGGAYWSLGLPDSARWAYEKAISIDERYAPGLASLADWYESDGEFEKALDYARRALAIAPENAQYLYSVGSLQVRLGNIADGIETLSRVLRLEPWNHSAELGIGQAYRGIGDGEKATFHVNRANELREAQMVVDRARRGAKRQPDNFQAQLDYATALQQSKRFEEAIAQFEVSRTLRPENLGLRNNIATLYLQLGQEEEALTRYQSIINDDSTFAEAWLNLALYYGRKGETTQANNALNQATKFGKDNQRVQSTLARLQNGEQ